jgi:heme oxygenase
MDLFPCLHETICEAEDRLDRTPLAQVMSLGRIARGDYARLLGQLWHLFAVLESELRRHPFLTELYPSFLGRHQALRQDLAFLKTSGPLLPLPPTQGLLASIRHWSLETPWALCGCMYVLEKMRLDASALIGPLVRALDVSAEPGQGLDFLQAGLADRLGAWKQFETGLRKGPLAPTAVEQIRSAAAATAEGIVGLYASLPASIAHGSFVNRTVVSESGERRQSRSFQL